MSATRAGSLSILAAGVLALGAACSSSPSSAGGGEPGGDQGDAGGPGDPGSAADGGGGGADGGTPGSEAGKPSCGASGFASGAQAFALPAIAGTSAQPVFDLLDDYASCTGTGGLRWSVADLTGDGKFDLVVTTACNDTSVGTTHWNVYAGSCTP